VRRPQYGHLNAYSGIDFPQRLHSITQLNAAVMIAME